MAISAREKDGVLKLVHPGGHVEIHRQPITAAEVMKRNPRHCVARTDVFENPWNVVKPESALLPGKVFYIVPSRTIYRLLKAKEQNNQNQFPEDHKPHNLNFKTTLPRKLSPGNTPKSKKQTLYFGGALESNLWEGVSSDEEGLYETLLTRNRKHYEKLQNENRTESTVGIRSSRGRAQYHRISDNEDPNGVVKSAKGETELKSCIKKHGNIRKALDLRITFANPITAEHGVV